MNRLTIEQDRKLRDFFAKASDRVAGLLAHLSLNETAADFVDEIDKELRDLLDLIWETRWELCLLAGEVRHWEPEKSTTETPEPEAAE